MNVAVIVNQASSNSVALGNYYCEQRGVPAENLFRIQWAGGNIEWTRTQYESVLLNPFLAALDSRGLSNQVRYAVLSMDIPFTVSDGSNVTSTTSCLFYGFKSGTKGNDNSYAFSEGAFGEVIPATAPGRSFLTTMITAATLAQARRAVDQGVQSDGTYPGRAVLLMKTSDPLRSIRHALFDNALFNTRVLGYDTLRRTNSDEVTGYSNLLGLQTGLASFSISPNTFGPGAMADSMTSFGGILFGPNSHTTALAFIQAGAAGSYGTVAEPGLVISKFPDPMAYVYQARGFSLAESYYLSIGTPQLGLVVGEPLAAPYARPGSATWSAPAANASLSGTVQAQARVQAADATHPIQRVELFVDGKFFQTLTNIAPASGNRVILNFIGPSTAYAVPAGATLSSIAQGVAALINQTATNRALPVSAVATGDRIQVRSLAGRRPLAPDALRVRPNPPPAGPAPSGSAFVSSAAGTAPVQTTFLVASRDDCLDSPVAGFKTWRVSGITGSSTWLRLDVTKTNGLTSSVAFTNAAGLGSVSELMAEFGTRLQSAPGLTGADGIAQQEMTTIASGDVTMTLAARAPGYGASGARARLTGSADLVITPAGEQVLRDNLADLEPRNHVLVRAGVADLDLAFPIDTRLLADGWHELTLVGCEGSHVRTQTRVSLPVQVRNTSLNAALTIPSHADTAPVQDPITVQVNATGATVDRIRLFSSGGEVAVVSGQSSATFTVTGTSLGVGRHPFWAMIEAPGGQRFRTDLRWLRLTP